MTDPSLDRFFDRLVHDRSLSRRDALRRLGALGLTLGGGSLLAACGGVEGTAEDQGEQTQRAAEVDHPQRPFDRLLFSNWPLYIDKDVLRDFERRYDADVRYFEDINSNDEFYGKVRTQLERGQSIERDLVSLTDWMVGIWVRGGFIEPIDKGNVPNASNLIRTLQDPPFDPGRRWSLPWQSGMTGIGYNREKVGREIRSFEDLFDPRFKGRVTLLSEARDTVGNIMLMQGNDPAKATEATANQALDRLEQAVQAGQIRQFTGNDYTTGLARGTIWIAEAWSGDVIQLQADNPELEFVIPESGGILWSDNMLMPKGVARPYAAETMMNYVYEPEVAAKIAEYVNYVSPVQGVQEVLERDGSEIARNELVFPTQETLGRLHPFPALQGAAEQQMVERFTQITGG
jgi:spermidine/putrescine transport system substrate-binding protein